MLSDRDTSPERNVITASALDATIADASMPMRIPPGMVLFTHALIRPGIFDMSERPAACATLKADEDCARAQDPSEVPERTLHNFYLDKYEVTNRDFAMWLDNIRDSWRTNAVDATAIETRTEPSVFLVRTGEKCGLVLVHGRIRPDVEKANRPATCMTWMAARDYCLAHPEHKRLPLDNEWEFAAKGSRGNAFPWGTSLPQLDGVAYGRDSSTSMHPVDIGTSKQDVSPQGVYDLGGNVAEWVESDTVAGATKDKMIRGGSWNSRDSCHLLSSGCKRIDAESFSGDVGFRCAKTVAMDKGATN